MSLRNLSSASVSVPSDAVVASFHPLSGENEKFGVDKDQLYAARSLVLRLRGGGGKPMVGKEVDAVASPLLQLSGESQYPKLVYLDAESDDESSGTPSEETTDSSSDISENDDASTYDPDTDDSDGEWDSIQPVSQRNKKWLRATIPSGLSMLDRSDMGSSGRGRVFASFQPVDLTLKEDLSDDQIGIPIRRPRPVVRLQVDSSAGSQDMADERRGPSREVSPRARANVEAPTTILQTRKVLDTEKCGDEHMPEQAQSASDSDMPSLKMSSGDEQSEYDTSHIEDKVKVRHTRKKDGRSRAPHNREAPATAHVSDSDGSPATDGARRGAYRCSAESRFFRICEEDY